MVAISAGAQSTDLEAERQRIVQERQKVMQESLRQEQRCHEQFVVTPCIEEVRARRRETLDELRREQAVLDGAIRHQKAAERLQRLADKQRAQRAALAASAPPPQVLKRESPASGADPAAARPAAERAVPARAGTKAATPSGQRARERAAYEARVREAQQHRDEVLKRNERRAQEGKSPAPPLPLPAASDVRR